MKKRNVSTASLLAVLLCWGALTLGMWFGPRTAVSEAERRPLNQAPEITMSGVLSGKFMTEFESFTLDQFPLRDAFRTLKSLFHYNVLGQKDNNGIYLSQGFAVKQEYPLSLPSLDHALERFGYVYETYLKDSGSRVVFALVPDKGQYLAEPAGNLYVDYAQMEQVLRQGMPWAQFVSLNGALTAESYYRTDTHWRQEALLPGAELICNALDVTAPRLEDYTPVIMERPFYGVYYGQAALPMEPDSMVVLDSPLLQLCRVYDYESGKHLGIYDWDKGASSRDQYDVYLSGARGLLTIENPNAGTDRELIVFRDSFGSSMVPLLIGDYARVTLVDIRYVQAGMLGRFLDFHGQDVLFLYSTLVLNNSQTIK